MYKGKLENVNQEMKRISINILGVSELRLKNNGHFNSEETTIYFSGNESTKRNGLVLLVNQKIRRSLWGYKPVCDRIIYVRLKAYPINITCIQVYASTLKKLNNTTKNFNRHYKRYQRNISLF